MSEPAKLPIKIKEVMLDDIANIALLAHANHQECAKHLPFYNEAIAQSYGELAGDDTRKSFNAWIAYKGEEPIGYAVATSGRFFFNFDSQSKLELLFVMPQHRGSWAAVRLTKAFEEWSRLNGCLQMYVGVARLDADEAKHIRKLFPKLGYNWCGSYYVKETTK